MSLKMEKKLKNNNDGTFEIQIIEIHNDNNEVIYVTKNLSLEEITLFVISEVKKIDDEISVHRRRIEELKNEKNRFKNNADRIGINV